MSDRLELDIGLPDKISGPASKAAGALKKVEDAANKAQSALSGKFANSWEKIGLAASKSSAKQQSSFVGAWGKIGAAAEKSAAKHQAVFAGAWGKIGLAAEKSAMRQQNAFANSWAKIGMAKAKAESKVKGFGSAFTTDNFGLVTTAAAAGTLVADGIKGAASFMVDSAKRVAEIVIDGFKRAVEESGKEETRRLAYRLTLGKEGGTSALGDVERFSKQTQFTRTQSAAMLLPLLRAGFSQKSARQEFATAADVQAGGGMSAEEFLGFAQHVKLKGGVTTKQLVGAGINAPEFFKSLSKKLGISQSEAEKRAKEGGKIDPQLILNEITEAVNKRQGGAAGTGAAAASKTLESRLAKLRDLPNEYLAKLVDSPSFGVLSDKIGSIIQRLDPESPQGQRIIAALQRVFEDIVGWIDELTSDDGIDSLVNGFESVLAVVKGVLSFVKSTADEVGNLIDKLKVVFDLVTAATAGTSAPWLNAVFKTDEKLNNHLMDLGNDALRGSGMSTTGTEMPAVHSNPLQASASANELAKRETAVGSTKVIPITQHITVNVTPPKDDVNHTGQQVGSVVQQYATSALERAAQGRGG